METPNTGKRVVIVGAGIGGLATAILLARDGYQVTVLERHAIIGGRASRIKDAGFTFDTGPSLYLMSDVFAHFFGLVGEKVEDHLVLKKLHPAMRVYFPGGRKIDLHGDAKRDTGVIDGLEPGAGKKLEEYLKRAEFKYETAKKHFLYKNYDSIFDFFRLRYAIDGARLSVFESMQKHVSRFFRTPDVQKLMQYSLVFLGCSPYNAPAMYALMSHLDFNEGVYFVQGGIYQIVEALARIAKKNGVTIKTNARVSRIETKDGIATGVRLENGAFIPADIVVSNADVYHTETALLDEAHRSYPESYWQSRVMSPSALIMMLGLRGKVPELAHHSMRFSDDWEKNFGEIFDTPKLPTDPSLYVCAPSITDPSLAPEGDEALFVLVPVAPGIGASDEEMKAYEEKVLDLIEKDMGISDLRSRIVVRRSMYEKHFAERFSSFRGSALGLAHSLDQTAIFRPNNQSAKVKNLLYVGANTVPGIGMPITLISAQLVWKRLRGDRSDGPSATVA